MLVDKMIRESYQKIEKLLTDKLKDMMTAANADTDTYFAFGYTTGDNSTEWELVKNEEGVVSQVKGNIHIGEYSYYFTLSNYKISCNQNTPTRISNHYEFLNEVLNMVNALNWNQAKVKRNAQFLTANIY